MTEYDEIKAPEHYVSQSIIVQPIDVIRTAPFDIGNCIKYCIRAGHKDDRDKDLAKALQYLKWAYESAETNPKIYKSWWKQFGRLVVKFKPFEGIDPAQGVCYFMDTVNLRLAYDTIDDVR